jgi:hypothetical protein
MGRIESFRRYAADCMQQAETQQSPQDRDILLNVALAWVRLAQQSETLPAAAANGTAVDQAAAAAIAAASAGENGKAGVAA